MAPRAERKLAAILTADVVGYSRLVGADEAGTIARLRALRKEFTEPLITEYHGRVVKLVGDGALVEFASAVDAVECAVALQCGVAERELAQVYLAIAERLRLHERWPTPPCATRRSVSCAGWGGGPPGRGRAAGGDRGRDREDGGAGP